MRDVETRASGAALVLSVVAEMRHPGAITLVAIVLSAFSLGMATARAAARRDSRS
jgi:hypothetical protein